MHRTGRPTHRSDIKEAHQSHRATNPTFLVAGSRPTSFLILSLRTPPDSRSFHFPGPRPPRPPPSYHITRFSDPRHTPAAVATVLGCASLCPQPQRAPLPCLLSGSPSQHTHVTDRKSLHFLRTAPSMYFSCETGALTSNLWLLV